MPYPAGANLQLGLAEPMGRILARLERHRPEGAEPGLDVVVASFLAADLLRAPIVEGRAVRKNT